MTEIKATTKAGQAIINELKWSKGRDIYEAYNNPSPAKVQSFRAIERRALETEGYNHDLHIVGANSNFYSTIYTYTQDGTTYAIKDTYANTYTVAM